MKIFKFKFSVDKTNFAILVSSIFVIIIVTFLGIALIRQFVIKQAESRIEAVMEEAEALHNYVQQEMHPAMYQLKKEGRMPEEFYSPEILSSSFITRRVFRIYNEIRQKDQLPQVEYRMASTNPRNKINQADSMETRLIEMFNRDSTNKEYIGIVTDHGVKHLYFARPFLRIKAQCLKCHGKREDAPQELSTYYKWDSGFNKKIGEVPAVEIIKTPLVAEYKTSTRIGIVILFAAIILITVIILYFRLIETNKIIRQQKNEIEDNLKKIKDAQFKLIQSEKMASLGVLTAGVAHEINNPLNFINGAYLGLDSYFTTKAPEHKEKVSVLLRGLQTGIDRASEIVQGLNHFSRNSMGYNEDCHLHAIIDSCLSILKNKYKATIQVERKYAEGELTIKGNEGKLHQVFINILLNAIQSIKDNGSIKIETSKASEFVLIRISDTGCGIKQEDLPKVLDPFFTTKAPGEGTGLGLSISYTIVREHQGDIEIQSVENKGTTVIITLPLTH